MYALNSWLRRKPYREFHKSQMASCSKNVVRFAIDAYDLNILSINETILVYGTSCSLNLSLEYDGLIILNRTGSCTE